MTSLSNKSKSQPQRSMLSRIAPQQNNRAVIIGTTGSGKSFLARFFLSMRKYVCILDTNDTCMWPEYERHEYLETLIDSGDRGTEKLIYAPCAREMRDEAVLQAFFEWNYERKNCTVYVDESSQVTDANYIPDGYFDLLTRGRARNIPVFSSTQRPAGIKTEIMSEAEHKYVFRLQMPMDVEKVSKFTPITKEQILSLQKREFFYANHYGTYGPFTLKVKE